MSNQGSPLASHLVIDKKPLSGVFTMLPLDDVYYGAGAISNLGAALAANGIERALLITGTTLATKTDLVDRVKAAADGRIAGVFHETVQHVSRESVLRATEAAREINADGIVSFGGGTPNDTGKSVVLALAEDIRKPEDFDKAMVKFEYPATIEVPPVTGDAVPMVAIPTTLSSGEFTHFSGITDRERQVKHLYIDKKLAAKTVILDPELTLATPLWLWLSSGMRSVDHCVEALCSTTAHPYVDAFATHALRMHSRFLRETKENPEDLDARLQCQIASWLSISGLANVTMGLSHGIGHQLGARNNVPHGHTSCVMMYATMEFNKDHVGDRHAVVAEALGVDISAVPDPGAAGREAIRQLVLDLDQPSSLSEVGVERSDFEGIAKDAMEDMVVATNPRPVAGVEEVIEILESAY